MRTGKPVYDWTIVDRIFDTYLERGVKPYVQIGFMPKAMSIKPEPYQHMWTPDGQVRRDLHGLGVSAARTTTKWGELAYQWAKHCVEKYGRAEVEQWYWETWNEANIGYWRGTPEEFRKLHDYAIDGVRRALPTARVGGPDSAGQRRPVDARLPRTPDSRQELRDRADRHADRLRRVPRQGPAGLRRRPRAHGDLEPARDHRRRVPDRRVLSRS